VSWSRLARDLFIGLGIAFVALRLFGVEPWNQSVDAYAYWSTRNGISYDESTVGVLGSYLYSPAFGHLLAPLTWLPWNAFNAIWTAMNVAIVWALLGRWSILALAFLPISFELVAGNVHLLYALVAVVGLRYPAIWLIPFITKLTPGIGLLWFVVRRQWRQLAIALGVTAAVVIASLVIAPDAWRQWVALMVASEAAPTNTPGFFIPIPLPLRLGAAAALVVWGARTDRTWVLPVAMALALPLLWLNGLAVLAALGPSIRRWLTSRRQRDEPRPVGIRTAIQA
jgi:hypothetical protein